MIRQTTPRRFHFGEFELDVSAYVLRRAGERIKLEKIPMEVLILLVERAGDLVDRQTLHDALWGAEVFVDRDSAINTAVRKIRLALADDVDKPQFIETVVGKGYRFIPTAASSFARARGAADYRIRRGTREFVLHSGENLLGRDPEAGVRLDHPSVSRRHARISIGSARATLEDLDSRNGTFVDGRRIDAPTEIRNGAIVGLGPVTLTFVVLSGPASTRPMSEAIVLHSDESTGS